MDLKITIKSLNNLVVEHNSYGCPLLKVVQSAQLDWMHACGGKGRCTTCMFVPDGGAGAFGPMTEAELRMSEQGRLPKGNRLACQATVLADASVSIPKNCRFPHMNYTD